MSADTEAISSPSALSQPVKSKMTVSADTENPPEIPHITTNYIPLSNIVSNLASHSYQELQNVLETLPVLSSDISKKRIFLDYIINSRQALVKLYVLSKWASAVDGISKCVDVVAWLNGQQNCYANAVNALYNIERTLKAAKLRNPDIESALEVLHNGMPNHKLHDFVPSEPLSSRVIYRVLRNLDVLLSIRLALVEELPAQYRNYQIKDGQVKFTIENSFTVDLGIADDSVNARLFLVDFNFCIPILDPEANETNISQAQEDVQDKTHPQQPQQTNEQQPNDSIKYPSDSEQQRSGNAALSSEDSLKKPPTQGQAWPYERITLPANVKLRLETIVNEKLKTEKLSSVLNWLLHFAQNHKLAYFNSQLHKMVRGIYAGHVQYSFYGSKSLIMINYWCQSQKHTASSNQYNQNSNSNQPQSQTSESSAGGSNQFRNVIEIGLQKNQNSKIGIRWLREGQPVDTEKEIPSYIRNEFGSSRFDIEWLVNQLMELHVKYIVESVYFNIKALCGRPVHEICSVGEPKHDMLRLTLTKSRTVVFSVDKLTGACVLSNPSNLITAFERLLNDESDPAHNAHHLLLKLGQASIQEDILSKAHATGWIRNVNIRLKTEDIQKWLNVNNPEAYADFRKHILGDAGLIFLRRPNWSPIQFLTVVVGLNKRPLWFISEIASREREWLIMFLEPIHVESGHHQQQQPAQASSPLLPAASASVGDSVTKPGALTKTRDNVSTKVSKPDPFDDYMFSVYSYNWFKSLAKFASSRFSIHYLCADLLANGMKFSLFESEKGDPALMVDMVSALSDKSNVTWAYSSLYVILSENSILVQGRTKNQLAFMSSPTTERSGMTLNSETGVFKFELNKTGGFAKQIVTRLEQVQRVVVFIDLVKSLSLDLISASMDGITLKYGPDPNLAVSILLTENSADEYKPTLKLKLDAKSPHHIVVPHLQEVLKQGGLLPVLSILQSTLPLYKMIQTFGDTVHVVSRSVSDLKLYFEKDRVLQVTLKTPKSIYVTNTSTWPGILDLWKDKGIGPGIIPLQQGIACPLDKVDVLFARIKQYI